MIKVNFPAQERLRLNRFSFPHSFRLPFQRRAATFAKAGIMALAALPAMGQTPKPVNVLTGHNDIARTGQNLQETLLTTSNVSASTFGKIFTQPVNGAIIAQPLYVANLTIPGKGVHNVVFVATSSGTLDLLAGPGTGDYVYAFDADTNGGQNQVPLWQAPLLTNSTPAGTYTVKYGVVGTPTIDLTTNTLYLVSSEIQAGSPLFRLHALDITTGAEKFGGPQLIQASMPGTGSGSVGGVLQFNAAYQSQRTSLLVLNGVVYIGFGSIGDQGPWHGWIFSYGVNAKTQTLQQLNVFCPTPNGIGGGIWMGGAGLAAEVYNPQKPYGRMFVATGNGTFSPTSPYSYSMSVLDFDLTGGQLTVEDQFTPFNQAVTDSQDGDLGSGGPVLLPTQTLASGKTLNSLVQVGKSGMIYILDRDNNADGSNNPATEYTPAGLGGYNTTADQVIAETQTPIAPGNDWGESVFGSEGYWNNTIYTGGTISGGTSSLAAYSFANGVLSSSPTSQSTDQFYWPGPTPAITANGTSNGILWGLMRNSKSGSGNESLLAYDATNLANRLYSSSDNFSRDSPGMAMPFPVPTISNGKVYVGTFSQLNIYGLLSSEPTAPAPVFSPAAGKTTFPLTVSISEAISTATIYYTTDGTVPTVNSPIYQGSFMIYGNTTVNAIASANGYLVSPMATVTYLSPTTPATPTFSLTSGTYTGTQSLTISDVTTGVPIYYTIDGSTPTAASPIYNSPISVTFSGTIRAIAIAPGPYPSAVASATYVILSGTTIDFTQGFALAQGPMKFNGSTDLDDFRLQLTNGGANEAGSAFFATPVNIQQFTTNFTFQLSNPLADGITFTIQNNSASAVGGSGGGLGYATIPNSVAIKFDLYSNSGEGPDSTGLYINGAVPTLPSISLVGTGIDLHSGDYINATLVYNGTTLVMTLTDQLTLATWTQSFTVNIPAIVGGNTAYVGFTGGTGGLSSSQKVNAWTYVAGPPVPSYSSGFTGTGMTLNGGATLSGTRLRLTDGGDNEGRSAFYTLPVNIQQFSTSFNFQLSNPQADGFTFTVQGVGPTALGGVSASLGYAGISNSVAVKFDLYNNQGEGADSTGLYTNGAMPTVPSTNLYSTPIDLHSGHLFNAQITYNGTTLAVLITDTVTGAFATQTYTVNIPSLVGGPTAYVGFTAGTGGLTAIQDIVNWTFSSGPPTTPSFAAGFTGSTSQLTFNGGAALNGAKLRLTDGQANEARSAFFNTPVNVQQFTTSFNFQLMKAYGDGMAFVIQGVGPNALGANGGSLGYGGITHSVAIKFDLYSNQGEGPDSTGLYLNGALPTVPSTDLSSTGINLHSGDLFNAQLVYNGGTLTVVITDTVTNATATQTYSVNIPATVGASTAYVGFSGGSGGASANQEILSWTYSPTNVY